jgi:hypothetical protein
MILSPSPTNSPCPAEFRHWLLAKSSALLYCSMANLPIGEGFCRLLSRDGRYGVVDDGDVKDK